jgi:hypothetical protein
MPPILAQFTKILEDIGINSEGLDKIRLGRGVIGKSTYVAIAALAVLGLVASRVTNEWFLISIAVGVLLLFGAFFFGSMKYAKENPGSALLEGAELITWRKQELAAKFLPNPPVTPPILDPGPNTEGSEQK